ncbi:MAG: hypothetical protein WBP58_14875 [Chitinophagaceae bacterium]
MKNRIRPCICVLFVFLFSLISCLDGTKIGPVVHDNKHDSANNRFGSLFEATECREVDIETGVNKLEVSIDSLLSLLTDRLQKSEKDSTMVNLLVNLIQLERKTYQSSAIQESELVFWSYGVAAMNGERVVARDCFYYRALLRKWQFYLAIEDKVEGTLLDL